MKTRKNKIYRPVSILENNHIIDGKLPIGSFIQTQWGKRMIVKNKVQIIDITQKEPYYA